MAGDWLSLVAGAWSLRLLSALLQRRSGRRLRAQAGQSEASRRRPVRRRLVGAQLLSGTKAEGGKKRGGGKKEERKRKRRLLTGWASARGLKLPGDRRGSR